MKFYGEDAGLYPGSLWGSDFQSGGEAEPGNSSLGRSLRCSCAWGIIPAELWGCRMGPALAQQLLCCSRGSLTRFLVGPGSIWRCRNALPTFQLGQEAFSWNNGTGQGWNCCIWGLKGLCCLWKLQVLVWCSPQISGIVSFVFPGPAHPRNCVLPSCSLVP